MVLRLTRFWSMASAETSRLFEPMPMRVKVVCPWAVGFLCNPAAPGRWRAELSAGVWGRALERVSHPGAKPHSGAGGGCEWDSAED